MLLKIRINDLTNYLTCFVRFLFWHKENQGKRYDNDLRLQQPCKQIDIKNYDIEHTCSNPWL